MRLNGPIILSYVHYMLSALYCSLLSVYKLLEASLLSSNIGFSFYLGSGLSNLKGSITRKSKKKQLQLK